MIAQVVEKFHSWSGSNRIRRTIVSKSGRLVLVATLLLIAGWRDATVLFRHPVAGGWNGYYYVLQVDSLSNQSHFYFPTRTPLVFYGLAGLRYLLDDTLLAIKIGGLFIHGLLCLGIFALLVSLTRSFWPGLIGMALAAFAPLHLFMVVEYIKQAGALCLLVWGCWAAVRAFQTRRAKWAVLSVALLTAASFSHKSAFFTEVFLAGLALLAAGLTSPKLKKWKGVLALTAALLIWTTPLLLTAQSYWKIPVWLKRELSQTPRWPLQTVAVSEGLVLLLVAPVLLFLLAFSMRGRTSPCVRIGLGALALWSLLVTINPFLNSDPSMGTVSGRLGLLAYLLVAILLPGFFWLIVSQHRAAAPYVAAAILPLLLLNVRVPFPPGLQDEYLQRRQLLINNLPIIPERLGNAPLVLAPHGDQFVVTSTIRVRSDQRLPGGDNDQDIFWLLDKLDCRSAPTAAIVLLSDSRNGCTVLLEDSQLSQLLDSMSDHDRHRLLSANPYFRLAHEPVVNLGDN